MYNTRPESGPLYNTGSSNRDAISTTPRLRERGLYRGGGCVGDRVSTKPFLKDRGMLQDGAEAQALAEPGAVSESETPQALERRRLREEFEQLARQVLTR